MDDIDRAFLANLERARRSEGEAVRREAARRQAEESEARLLRLAIPKFRSCGPPLMAHVGIFKVIHLYHLYDNWRDGGQGAGYEGAIWLSTGGTVWKTRNIGRGGTQGPLIRRIPRSDRPTEYRPLPNFSGEERLGRIRDILVASLKAYGYRPEPEAEA